MGLALLFVIWLITLASTYFFAARTWWLPPGASMQSGAIDQQFVFTYVGMGVVFLAAQLGLGLFVWKYRDRAATRVAYSHGNTRMEILWTVLTAILFVGLNLMGTNTWAEARFRAEDPRPNAVAVEVTGLQFQWYFRYPGPDGKYGRTVPKLIDASEGGKAALGIDPTDGAGNDDIVVNTMMIPEGRPVNISLRAQDVIHDFFIPAMRIKQDAVPGLTTRMHFEPTRAGDYEVACAELCGLGHYRMRALVRVVPQAQFDSWMAERQAENQ